MKKTLLLAAVATLSLSANAQWVRPDAPNHDIVVGQKVRLYNIEYGAFLGGANAWGTQTSLITPGLDYTLLQSDNGTDYKIQTSSGVKNGKLVFRDNTSGCFIDMGTQNKGYNWTFTKTESGYYTIKSPQDDAVYGETKYPNWKNEFFGWNGDSNIVYANVASDDGIEWAIMSEEEAATFSEKNADAIVLYRAAMRLRIKIKNAKASYPGINVSEADAVYENTNNTVKELEAALSIVDRAIEVYRAKELLNEKIQNALAKYPDLDLSEAKSVYDNANSTLEDVNAAMVIVNRAYGTARSQELLAGASEENAINATELLENPDFSNGTINGWVCTFVSGVTATNIGYQQNADYNGLPWTDDETGESGTATISKFIEAWANNVDAMKRNGNSFATVGDGKLYQIIYGLPAGKYKLSCNAMAKQQWDEKQNPVTGVQLYALAGGLDNYKNMATGNDGPVHFIMEFVHGGGDVELGLRTQMSTANWICADDFKLVYYGELKENPYQILLKKAVAEAESTYTLDEVKASAEAKNIYTTALEAAKAAEDEQEDAYYQELQTKLENAISALNESANLMRQLVAAYNAAEEKLNIVKSRCKIDCSSVADELVFISQSIETGLKTDAMIKEAIDDVTNNISTLFTADILDAKNAASATVQNPVDITAVISNSTYDWTAADGSSAYWTNTGTAPHGWNKNGLNEDGSTFVVAEVWNGTFTHTQQISGLIPGYYALQVNAFQRGAGNDAHSAQAAEESGEPLTASLFVGEDNIPVASVFSEVDKYAETCANEDGSIPGATIKGGKFDGKVVPNNMTEATNAFNAGLYVNELQFEVKEGQSVVEFGLSKEVMQGDDWVIFGNWNLKYYGTKNPNTPTAITDVNAAPAAKAIYDLTGRKVSKAVKGIYVINNKKVVK